MRFINQFTNNIIIMKKYFWSIFGLVIISFAGKVSAQNTKNTDFNIYVLTDRYDKTTQDKLLKSSISFKDIKILGSFMYDPNRIGEINFKSINKHIIAMFPDKYSNGVLNIDIENQYYHDLMNSRKGSKKANQAIDMFVNVIDYIKELRPNVKIGVYGMPYRMRVDAHSKRNMAMKLDPILSKVDILMPSLYFFSPEQEVGLDENFRYLENNLKVAFEYAERLNKEVIPFVWYLIHPNSESEFLSSALPRDEMSNYISMIKNSSSVNGTKVSGVIWWDTFTPYKNKSIKYNLLSNNKKLEFYDVNSAIIYYLLSNKF